VAGFEAPNDNSVNSVSIDCSANGSRVICWRGIGNDPAADFRHLRKDMDKNPTW
jgi:hypothetical protein